MRRLTSVLFVSITAVGLLLAGSQAPTADPAIAPLALRPADQAPPHLTVPIKPSFVIGDTIVISDFCGWSDPATDFAKVEQRFTWSATDASGWVRYSFAVGSADITYQFENSQQTQLVLTASDYNGDCGAGAIVTDRYLVTASDRLGNATTKQVGSRGGLTPLIVVNQEDNTSVAPLTGQISYSGAWSMGNCLCALGGHTKWTTAKGASVTFTRTYAEGDHVAVVMAKGPGRGRASILVDGVSVRTIDTYAAANANRVVVFERSMPSGTHTVTIVNLATAGHPRIDLDAVMTN